MEYETDAVSQAQQREQQIDNRTANKSTIEPSLEPPVGKRMRPSDQTEYDTLLDQLADRLKIARHPDSLVTIKAARLLIENILAASSLSSKFDHGQQSSADFSRSGSSNDDNRTTISANNKSNDDPKATKINLTNNQQAPAAVIVSDRSDSRVAIVGLSSAMRIQQTKFSLDDVSLPASLVSSWSSVAAMTPKQINDDQSLTNKETTTTTTSMELEQQGANETTARRKDELKGALERASKSLKLLYLNDQKKLQLQVNEIISSIQSITANPKTDSKLLSSARG